MIKHKYNIDNAEFLNYYKLIESISKDWKNKLKIETETENTVPSLLQNLLKQKSPNKFIYNVQAENIRQELEIKPQVKWNNLFENLNWNEIYKIPFESTIDNKLRSFQYKYLMRIIPTNNYLYKCNITETSLCDFCNSNVENIQHLFWECQLVRAFWTELDNYLLQQIINIHMNFRTICFGVEKSFNSTTINCIIIIGKYFIFKNKYAKTIPVFGNFITYVKKFEQIERMISNNKDKLHIHLNKWNKLNLSN
jgi:hypothetical protein